LPTYNTKEAIYKILILLIFASLGANLAGLIVSTISDRLGDHFAGRLQKYLTEKFYDKVLTLPQSYFDSEVSGKIVNQLNRGIVTIRGFSIPPPILSCPHSYKVS